MQADSRGGGQPHVCGRGLGKRPETAGCFNPRNRGRKRDTTQVQGPSTLRCPPPGHHGPCAWSSQAAHSSLLLTCMPPPVLIISASGTGSRRAASPGGPRVHSTVPTLCMAPSPPAILLCGVLRPPSAMLHLHKAGLAVWGGEGAWLSRILLTGSRSSSSSSTLLNCPIRKNAECGDWKQKRTTGYSAVGRAASASPPPTP